MPFKLHHTHDWDLPLNKARSLQYELRNYVHEQPLDMSALQTIGGVDAGYRGGEVQGAAAVLDFKTLELIE